ncbi:MAG: DMT family transporter [Gemmataceae bacterium]
MLTGCFAFAWMSEFAHQLGPACDWRIVALARSFLAFVFAFSIARMVGARLVFWSPGILWMRSFAGSLSLLCTFFALTRLRTSEVLTLTNTFPIWVAILSWPLLRVRPGLSVWLAALCGVLGIIMIRRPDFDAIPGASLAVPLSLIAAFTSALAMLGLHRLRDLDPWAIVVHFSGVATAFVLLACLFGEEPPKIEPLGDYRNLLLLVGVGATATLGQLCLTRAFTLGTPSRVSIVGLTQILFAMGLDLAFGGKPFDASTLAGIGLVLAPTAWVMAGKAGD